MWPSPLPHAVATKAECAWKREDQLARLHILTEVLAAPGLPHTRDFSDARVRRATMLECNRKFLPSEMFRALTRKLGAERPGVQQAALLGVGEVFARGGITRPALVDRAVREWRLEADQAAEFAEDPVEFLPGARASSSAVFARWQRWAAEAGIARPMGRKGLTDR